MPDHTPDCVEAHVGSPDLIAGCAPPLTYGEAVLRGVKILTGAGIEQPHRDARLLLAHVMGATQTGMVINDDHCLPATHLVRFVDLCRRRCRHEPVSRIVGQRAFWNAEFTITDATLDPRPDTELLVETALEIVRQEGWDDHAINILDLGTGSGCIALALLLELPQAHAIAVDRSERAIAVARGNAELIGVLDRCTFLVADWSSALSLNCELVVSNPPYIPSNDLNTLMPDVRLYDPAPSLDGGLDGLSAYRHICAGIAQVQQSGWVVFEIAPDASQDVVQLLLKAGYGTSIPPSIHRDLAGWVRCVAAHR